MKSVALLRGYLKDAAYQRVVRALAAEYGVTCLLWDRQGDFRPSWEHPQVSYRLCRLRGGYYNLWTALKIPLFNLWLLRQLLVSRCDIIHAFDLDTGVVGLLAAKLTGRKFVYHCLDAYHTVIPKSWPGFLVGLAKRLEDFVVNRADLFVITDLLRLPQHAGTKPRQVLEFANVPPLQIQIAAAGRKSSFVVGYIGSLNESRSLAELVEVVGELQTEGVSLVIGGFGNLEARLRLLAERYANVEFISWIPYERVLELESTFDVMAVVFDKEDEAHRWGSPNKFFEAMALGKPLIVGEGTVSASRALAVGNGVAVTYGNKVELREVILLLKNRPELAAQMGRRGRDLFLHEYNLEVMAARLLDAYRNL